MFLCYLKLGFRLYLKNLDIFFTNKKKTTKKHTSEG